MEKSKRPETYRIMHTLERTIIDNDGVDLEQYLLLWKHICRIMSSWSTIFSFVVKDVMNKAEKLTEMLDRDAVAYKTIMSMAQKEDENGTIRNKKPNRSGTGHLLVLNRALEFVITLLQGVFTATDDDTRVSSIARVAYEKHLAEFHAWPTRASVYTALYTLPRKKEFLIRLRGEMPESDDEEFHKVFQRDGRKLVRRVKLLVDKFKLHDYNPSA